LFYDGVQFNMLGRAFRMPKIGQSQDDPNVCLPWADSINGNGGLVRVGTQKGACDAARS
jgi:hypothetical protein